MVNECIILYHNKIHMLSIKPSLLSRYVRMPDGGKYDLANFGLMATFAIAYASDARMPERKPAAGAGLGRQA